MTCDTHVHFFSPAFFDALGAQKGLPTAGRAGLVARALSWELPDSAVALANRWAAELDRQGVARAALIASVPDDEASVATAVAAHPQRFVGFFMLDPTAGACRERVVAAAAQGLRGVCLFPAMHHFAVHGAEAGRVVDAAAGVPGMAVFVHCGVLSVGARAKLGLPSRFDVRLGNPLDLQGVALAHPQVPFIVPHFGAGLFREALILADACPNVYLDTSSSNRWMRYTPGLTLTEVFKTALDVVGSRRLLFGTDSSFFPRGWQLDLMDTQWAALSAAGASDAQIADVMFGNFQRLFPLG
jgi:uncharacterized protein